MLDRFAFGAVTRASLRSKSPLGWPSFQEKKSPLMPTAVPSELSLRSIAVTVSRRVTVSLDSAGASR
jgi:hypothetical protein